jgi:LmbE family N-acetylglucosaminyl deacetylase
MRISIRWLVVMAVAAGACGGDSGLPDGDPLAPATELTIVAHPDDDLTFLQPDLYDAVKRGTGATTVYVTIGEGAGDVAAAEARYDGAKSAYAAIAGDHDWSCGWIALGAINALHCRLAAENISLVFLGYPEGGEDGAAANSLLQLWEGNATDVPAVARRASTYSQTSLIQVVADIIDATAPATLRTLEVASTHGPDHSDHMLVGALVVLATARSSRAPALLSYRGDNTASEPANTDPALYPRSADLLLRYDACATGCGRCGDACAADQLDADQSTWLARRYAIDVRRTGNGTLQQGTGCIIATAAGTNAVIGDCAAAPAWQLDAQGTLRTAGNLCLQVFLTGEITVAACGADPGLAGRFFLDDDGHLWSGVVPAAQDDMALAHLYCVGVAGGRPRAGLCGAARAPSWTFTATTAR